jgi:hypothetical protein
MGQLLVPFFCNYFEFYTIKYNLKGSEKGSTTRRTPERSLVTMMRLEFYVTRSGSELFHL